MLAGGDARAQILAVVEDAQVTHIRQFCVRNIQQAIARAGGEHEMAIVDRLAGGELQLARCAVDRHGMVRDQLDVLIVIKLLRPEHQRVRTAGALEIGLRQRRPLIWQMSLVVDDRDAILVAELAQGSRDLESGVAGADDQNRSLRHRDNPNIRARKSPMSSPLPADSGLPSSLESGARVRCPGR